MSTAYAPESTALILLDVLNDFLAEDGKLYGAISPMLEELDTIDNLGRLLEGARASGLHIIYAPHGLDEHSFDDVKEPHPTFQGAMRNQVFWEGSRGADFFEPLRPREGETILRRHRMFNSFFGTDLAEQLRALKIEKVVIAGLTALTCVEGTGRHALESGYHLTYISDAVAEFTEAGQRAAVEISYPAVAHEVLGVEAFLGSIGKPLR